MTLDLRTVASRFYRAMSSGDTADLSALIDSSFADEVTLSRPESLPGGGNLVGRDRVTRFVTRAAGRAPLHVKQMMESAAGTDVFAHVEVRIGAEPVTALEWWTSDGTAVLSVRAFYWDTAAIVGQG